VPYRIALGTAAAAIPDGSTAVLIASDAALAEALAPVAALERRGVHCVAVTLDSASFGAPPARRAVQGRHHVRLGGDLAGAFAR
jgi:hypothetical protein